MKTLLLLLLSSFASAAGTKVVTQDVGDIGGAAISWTAAQTFSGTNAHSGVENFNSSANFTTGEIFGYTFSSMTISIGNITAATTAFDCKGGTLTYRSNGHPANIDFTGYASLPATGSQVYFGWLIDGVPGLGQTSTAGRSTVDSGGNTADGHYAGFHDVVQAQSNGTHSVCVWAKASAGGVTFTLPQANTVAGLYIKEQSSQR